MMNDGKAPDPDERLPCGHTQAEHQQRVVAIAKAVASGDLTPLVAYLGNDALIAAAQATLVELFIRSQDDEVAETNWNRFKGLIESTFFSEESAHPEVQQEVRDERKRFAEAVEKTQFEDEAQDEMRALFEKHGVHEEKPDIDDAPGFYL